MGLGTAVEVALRVADAEVPKSRLLQQRLDAFGHDLQVYAGGKGADRCDNGRRNIIAVDSGDE